LCRQIFVAAAIPLIAASLLFGFRPFPKAKMFRTQLLRQAARSVRASQPSIATRQTPSLSLSLQRSIHATSTLRRDEKEEEHEGSFARTDSSVQVEYPEEHDLPSSAPVQGRGGLHFKRTLASFSLEGRVGVVTGGARGLGLVMSQAMVISGADVAIVDLNSMFQSVPAISLC
jgi:hypothetical protein